MGGLFGIASQKDCVLDLYYGTDYHSHLGTKRGGMCLKNGKGYTRSIHNIENDYFHPPNWWMTFLPTKTQAKP